MAKELDVITIGRSSVDLYGNEIGTPLEEVDRFRKSVGGCPANIAIGSARLGLKSAIVTRVGNEQMGKFITSEMKREGVNTRGIRVDESRLTALVLLAVKDRMTFPHIFYREDCADMALCEEDVDPDLIGSAKCLLVTGTHFSTASVSRASWKAIHIAKKAGLKVVLDIDFRPSLWGLASHAAGDSRLVLSPAVRESLLEVLSVSDVIVGTEEEFCAAYNKGELAEALMEARRNGESVIVCKKGARGCEIYLPAGETLTGEPICGKQFSVPVMNTIGAGDAFLSGFLKGWLGGEDWESTATLANACGAIAVSRLLCSSEYPTWPELQAFITSHQRRSHNSGLADIEHIHWVTTRRTLPDEMFILAFDHRWQFEELAEKHKTDQSRLSSFKKLAVRAAGSIAARLPNIGIICDDQYGSEALFDAEKLSLWAARSIEIPRARPLAFITGQDVGSALVTWPRNQTVKCLWQFDPADSAMFQQNDEEALIRLHQACKSVGRELLVEIIPLGDSQAASAATLDAIKRLYKIGIAPDWWKLLPFKTPEIWREIGNLVQDRDPYCRGVLILGQTASLPMLEEAFVASAECPVVRGFAVGRAILGEAADEWTSGRASESDVHRLILVRFESVIASWRNARPQVIPISTSHRRTRGSAISGM